MDDSKALGFASNLCCDAVFHLEKLERRYIPDGDVTEGGNAYYMIDAELLEIIIEDLRNVANITLDQSSET